MSEFQTAIAPRRVVAIGGRNYEIGEIGPGVFSDFEAEARAQRIRELRLMKLSPLEFGECVAAIQRGAGQGKEELQRSLSSTDGLFILLWIVLRKSNPGLTLAGTKALLDAEPGAVEDIMGAMGIERDGGEGEESGVEDESKNVSAAQV